MPYALARPTALRSTLVLLLLMTTAVAGDSQRAPLVTVPEAGLEDVKTALREELKSARANLDAAILDEGTDATALANAFGLMGSLYLAVSEQPAAQACLINATRLATEDARWYMPLGATFLAADQSAKALEAFETAHRLAPNDPVIHLRLGQLLASEPSTVDRSIKHLRAARAAMVDNQPILVSLGKALAQTDQHQAALEAFDSALGLDPDNWEALNYRARARSQVGDDAGAVTDLRRLVKHNPSNRQARLDLAAIFTRQGNFPGAELQLEAALGLDLKPQARILALFNLAGLRQQVGDHVGAIRRYQEVLALAPDLPDANFNLGIALAREGRFGDAASHFERVTRATPDNASAWVALARALASAGRPNDAINDLERGLEQASAVGMNAAGTEQLRQLLGNFRER